MNKKILAIGVSLGCVISLIIFHLIAPTLLNQYEYKSVLRWSNIDESYMDVIVHYHETHPVFAGRPLTTGLIEAVHHLSGMGYGSAFVIVEGLLLVVLGYSIYLLSYQLTKNETAAIAFIVVFFTSYTVLFAFFASIYTYDEPLQYIGICWSLLLLLRQSWFVSGLMILVSLWARETTVIILPAIAWYIVATRPVRENIFSRYVVYRVLMVCVIPVVVYVVSLLGWLDSLGMLRSSQDYLQHERFANLQFNFQNQSFTIESLLAPVLTVAWPIIIYFFAWPHIRIPRIWRQMAMITFVLNTPIVLFTAYARESRLFALPLIFVWPAVGASAIYLWGRYRQSVYGIRFVAVLSTIFIFTHMVKRWLRDVYYPTAPGNFADGYRWYIAFIFALSLVCAATMLYLLIRL
jgi:hypothetical protein